MARENLIGRSPDVATPSVKGEFTGTGPTYIHDGGKGIQGHSQNGYGVHGISEVGRGVVAESDTNYGLRATSRTLSAARCSSAEGTGVEGEAGSTGDGVRGTSKNGNGIHGFSETAYGVKGESNSGRGVAAFSDTNYGLRATSRTLAAARCSSVNGNGVEGEAGGAGTGVSGSSISGRGINGFSNTGQAIYGHSIAQAGLVGESDQFDGIFGFTHSPLHAGISGHNPGGMAGFFEGDVVVTGDIRLANADFAEEFEVTLQTVQGEVMVLTDTDTLEPSTKAYDKKVVGVISGAGQYKPGIILDKQDHKGNRKPVAMMGKVYCKVEADTSPIETGDMLTSSDIPGFAMKAIDPLKAFGAVIGKALGSLKEGKGLIPILVVLQ